MNVNLQMGPGKLLILLNKSGMQLIFLVCAGLYFISMKCGVMELVLFYIQKMLECECKDKIAPMVLKLIEIIVNTNMSANIIVLYWYCLISYIRMVMLIISREQMQDKLCKKIN